MIELKIRRHTPTEVLGAQKIDTSTIGQGSSSKTLGIFQPTIENSSVGEGLLPEDLGIGGQVDPQTTGKKVTQRKLGVFDLSNEKKQVRKKTAGGAALSAISTVGFIVSSYFIQKSAHSNIGALWGYGEIGSVSGAFGGVNLLFSGLKHHVGLRSLLRNNTKTHYAGNELRQLTLENNVQSGYTRKQLRTLTALPTAKTAYTRSESRQIFTRVPENAQNNNTTHNEAYTKTPEEQIYPAEMTYWL